MIKFKNLLSGLIVGASVLCFCTVGIKAEDLTFNSSEFSNEKNNITAGSYIKDSEGNDLVTFDYSYDETAKLTTITSTMTLDADTITSILNHKPGNANSTAQKGTVYFWLKPTIANDENGYKKYQQYFGEGDRSFGSIEQAKQEIDNKIGQEHDVQYTDIYPIHIKVLVNNGTGKFVALCSGDCSTNGDTTIGDQLLAKYNAIHAGATKSDASELVYGTDYVFYSYKEISYLNAWKTDSKTEYILTNNKVNFPIESEKKQTYTTEYYFPSLKDALASPLNTTESNDITAINVNEDITLEEEITIPEEINVNLNAKLSVPKGMKLTINGNLIIGEEGSLDIEDLNNIDLTNGSIQNSNNKELHKVIITTDENGEVTVDNNLVENGGKVKITITPNSGYELNTLVVSKTGGTVEVLNNEFTMPDEDVTITATFKLKEPTPVVPSDEENNNNNNNNNTENKPVEEEKTEVVPEVPKTIDNILTYAAIGHTSLFLIVLIKKFRKMKEC